MAGIGHNQGPSISSGNGWNTHCWRVARKELMPSLPIEVLRQRVARAKTLGLPYKTYAGIRAQTGHDVSAFLFSSNGLGVTASMPTLVTEVVEKLEMVQAGRIGLASAPLSPSILVMNDGLDAAYPAPYALASFRQTAQDLRAALGVTPADRVVLVGMGTLERDWVAAGRLAGWVSAEHFFLESNIS